MKLALLLLLLLTSPLVGWAQSTTKKSPEHNFEAFWQLFNQHYAHFETRGVDWNQQYQRYRPLVNARTSDPDLLAIMNQMVAPLRDGHVVISPTGDLPASAKYSRFLQEYPTKEQQRQFQQVTLAYLQKRGFGAFTKFQSERYQLGGYCRSDRYGYLQLNGFGGMPLDEFARQLDEMVVAFADVEGLLLDIRINGGGAPAYLNALTSRLTQVRRLVGFGRTRWHKPHAEYSPWSAYYLQPATGPKLIKPTLLLTSGATISAGDHCALYLKELPYVRLIGENTNGIFSPMYGATLPNGWQIALSDGQSVDPRRISYEGRGVPVDLPVVHRREDTERGLDVGIQKALSYFEEHTTELKSETICYEQLALDFYADSLLTKQIYGQVTAYSMGLVEEDATLLAPFADKCASLQAVYGAGPKLRARIEAERGADARFYRHNVQHRFYVQVRRPLRTNMQWPFVKRNARRLTLSYHLTIGDKQYVRIHLLQGAGKGQSVLIVLNQAGQVVEHCFLTYDYLNG
ncbi:S41 family peptidase [Fibrella sp. WM1]|uniref:S41 family peptidase n=1 Tax=Fibrella musci TaxID=3242485 RepID=UPI0035215BB9